MSHLVPDAPPVITASDAEALARDVFGVDGAARQLSSNQDRNFALETATGRRLLKIANPAIADAELEAQSRAALWVRERAGVRAPGARAFADGTTVRRVAAGGARLLDFLDGGTFSGGGHLSPTVIDAMGALAASLDLALADFADAGVDRVSQWDLRRAREVLAELLPGVPDPLVRTRLGDAAEAAWAAVAAVAGALPMQVIHGDLTDDNIVAAHGPVPVPDGVIDFGDLHRSWRVGELAVTVSSLLHHDGVGLADAVRAVTAYHRAAPLADAELDALWPLVVLRGAVLMASAHRVLTDDPHNAYAAENLAHEQAIFDAATSVPLPVATALVRAAAGAAVEVLALPGRRPLLADPAGIEVLDLSATSPLLHEGRWLDDGVEAAVVADALEAGARVVMTRFAEPRLTRSRPGEDEPDNVVLGVEVTTRQPIELRAPWAGELRAGERGAGERGAGDRAVTPAGIVLTAPGVRLRIAPRALAIQSAADADAGNRPDSGGAAPSELNCRRAAGPVAAGEVLGTVTGTVLITVDDGTDLPDAVTPSLAAAWRTIAADPTPLILGHEAPAVAPDAVDLLARRAAHLAEVQEHYFAEPPVIVRGWRELLVDTDGRVYLDAMNNVTSIGHAHPRLVDAVAEQWRLINTNSRFHYPAIVEFSERLAALLPEGLDHVFLVNSGSEAVDLALRLARAATGRRDILAVREAYHGWTDLTDAVSTSIADNPNALSTRPEWVHTVDAPNSFRGPHAGDPTQYARDAVAEVERLAAAGTPPGAFLAESLYGNAGGIALPDGYLAAMYEAVRVHGGLAVADEVQVGYGRLGEWFWGFEQQGVVPDVVAVAKAMGNGHPLGAVITTKAIADAYRTQGYFFSSAGGSPVSSAVGLAVLDVIRDEQLQRNAREVGAYLKERLQELGARHPLLGTVHGYGLYLGPEFVRDRSTQAPATEETTAICERMRRLGVMIQPTGDHQNVLKIKPPLCFTTASADAFVAALDRALTTGW